MQRGEQPSKTLPKLKTRKLKRPLWKEAVIQTIAGGSAGFLEVLFMHPLDLVKTRLQLQNVRMGRLVHDDDYYRGTFDCLLKMKKNEGLLACYKGILPPILIEIPKRAVKFGSFEQFKKLFLNENERPTPSILATAGCLAGCSEALVINPFEVVKINMQADRTVQRGHTFRSIVQNIMKTEGLMGFTKGLDATIARNAIFNTTYFGFYYSAMLFLPIYDEKVKEFLKKVLLGFTAGSFGSILNIPFDVAKSRIQGPQKEGATYKTLGPTLFKIYHEEGILALYKGLIPKILRMGPGGAIMFLSFEYVYKYFDTIL